MNSEIKLAVIGSGRWGINHVKTARQLIGAGLKYVCDSNIKAEEKVKQIDESIPFISDIEQVINDKEINGVIIATPAETHHELVKRMLINGKNVLVEKPITLKTEQAVELLELSNQNNKILMVGHVLLYHPAIVELKKQIKSGKIGKLQYIYSNRLNLGTIRSEENILWSFAPHDISVIQYITESQPISIDARGSAFVQKGIEDTTLTYLVYPDNVYAHIYVSWLHPFKEQRLVVIGDKGMLVFEDSLPKDKLKFYPKGFKRIENGFIEKFESECEVINFKPAQPLAEEHLHFYNCITENKKPLTDGAHALSVLKILETATLRLKNHGTE